eukprot:scaffold1954_cov268-Pinguiococcus_pyrenoidosus.AAC.161
MDQISNLWTLQSGWARTRLSNTAFRASGRLLPPAPNGFDVAPSFPEDGQCGKPRNPGVQMWHGRET